MPRKPLNSLMPGGGIMGGDRILAIDCGTQSVRAILFDGRGNRVAAARSRFIPYVSPRPGWAEQHPSVYWDALCRACRTLWTQPGADPDSVAGVGLTTQRGTVINVDADGEPIRPAILWLDQRRAYGLPPLSGAWGMGFRLAGVSRIIAYFRAEAEANWLRAYQPELLRKTHKYLFLSGYLTHRLTGRFVDSTACQVGYVPFDYRRSRWAPDWDWKWRALPLRRDQLPDLVPPGAPLGRITRRAATETGIPRGRPLIAAAADKACEALGAGALTPDVACIGYGTTATVSVTHRRYRSVIPLLPPYPAAIPGHHSLEVQIFRGYWMVSWFKEQFGQVEQQAADLAGVSPESLFDQLIDPVPPGALGLVLLPYWTPGIRFPGPEARGAVIGFGDVHTRGHLYRAIIEGLAYGLREGAEKIQRRTHRPITSLRVAGGGSQSRHAMQVTADVFGLPASRPRIFEAAALGAAIDAASGLGTYPDVATAAREMTQTGETVDPDPDRHRLYDEIYRGVYRKLYTRLKPLYERLREITGYPP